ncbi:MAG: hypothetical protein ACXAEX_22970 [Promethearchaeota archaeon]
MAFFGSMGWQWLSITGVSLKSSVTNNSPPFRVTDDFHELHISNHHLLSGI